MRGSSLLLALLRIFSVIDTAEPPSKHLVSDDKNEECFLDLGCFSMKAPWHMAMRPFPPPLAPSVINTMLYYYSRTSSQRFDVTVWPTISLNEADFSAHRPVTAFITHGFSSNGKAEWLINLKEKYLQRVDANVFLIDWGDGACQYNYLHVASNTRVVAAKVTRFIKWLIKNRGLDASTIHLMGHSLGAHICSYIGKQVPNIGRLTAFDPAQPGFEGAPEEVRLNKGDAIFVEVLHTNSVPFIPLFGFGLMNPHGDVDFYINGGCHQPGCQSILTTLENVAKKILHLTDIRDLANFTVEELGECLGCSHFRSYLYYTAALDCNCTMWGQSANLVRRVLDGGTKGILEPLFTSLNNCTEDTCLPMGLETPLYKARGPFSIMTADESPYCNYNASEHKVLMALRDAVLKTKSWFSELTDKVKNVGGKIKKVIENILVINV